MSEQWVPLDDTREVFKPFIILEEALELKAEIQGKIGSDMDTNTITFDDKPVIECESNEAFDDLANDLADDSRPIDKIL